MYSQLKKTALSYLYTGVSNADGPELARKIVIVNLFGAVGASITFILGMSAFFNQDNLLGYVLIISSILYALSHQFQRLDWGARSYQVSAGLLQANLMGLMLYLVVSGGAANTGPLWIFLIPPVFMFFGGLKGGMISIGIFVLLYSILVFYPDDGLLITYYTTEFKTRILFSFLTLTFLSGFYEYSRHRTYLHLKELSDRFEQQARRDHLTQLPNRRAMKEQLEYEVSRAHRNKHVFSLLMLDIDHFKQINDTFGHDCGDKVLKRLSEYFVSHQRQQDMVSRWGGEEFLFLLPQTSSDDAFVFAEKVRAGVEQLDWLDTCQRLQVTVSIGIGSISQARSLDDAIKQADDHLYQAKQYGRNRIMPAELQSTN